MDVFAESVLLVSLGLLFYTYVGYALVLGAMGYVSRRRGTRSDRDPRIWPHVSIVLSAYNEESVIARRIENLLDVDYPPDRMHIVIGSDGSSDRTSEIVRRYRTARVKFHDFALRRGKAYVLNDLLSRVTGDLVVFTDANTFFHPDALKELVRGFSRHADACAVVGKLEFRTSAGTVNPDNLYWRYETVLKTLESRFGSVLGANGAIYAIKRTSYRPLPAGTIVDDFLIPMLMRLDGGGSVVFQPTAKAWELTPQTVRDEFWRRVRIGSGDAHALMHTWRLLLPGRGMLAFSYWSHKILRWLGPVLLLAAFLSNLWLLDRWWAQGIMAFQLAAYGQGLASRWLRSIPLLGRVSTGAWYFMVLNAALFVGFVKFVRGTARPTWRTTSRTAELTLATGRPKMGKVIHKSQANRPAA